MTVDVPSGRRGNRRGAWFPWPAALAGLALIVVIRPVAGFLSLRGAPGHAAEHWVIGAFGIRGIGSFYYLAYATSHVAVPHADLLWATVGLVVLVSVVAHGIAATPVMRLLDRFNERTPSPRSVTESP
jgi:sodium/hydrogen antiporter